MKKILLSTALAAGTLATMSATVAAEEVDQPLTVQEDTGNQDPGTLPETGGDTTDPGTTVDPVDPGTDPVDPGTDPGTGTEDPGTGGGATGGDIDPGTDPVVDPIVDPVDPGTGGTEPIVDPVTPEPTEPTVDPVTPVTPVVTPVTPVTPITPVVTPATPVVPTENLQEFLIETPAGNFTLTEKGYDRLADIAIASQDLSSGMITLPSDDAKAEVIKDDVKTSAAMPLWSAVATPLSAALALLVKKKHEN